MIRDLELIKDINILFDNKLILYGNGSYGKECLEMIHGIGAGEKGILFCDSKEENSGKIVNGIRTISLSQLKEMDASEDCLIVIITSSFYNEINEILEKEMIALKRKYTAWGLKHSIHANIYSKKINTEYQQNYLKRFKIWNYLYEKKDFYVPNLINTLMGTILDYRSTSVLVYTGGRVGTGQIENSLRKNEIIPVALHHFLKFYDEKRTNFCVFNDIDRIQEEYEYFHEKVKKKDWKIITLVREPIAMELSGVFAALDSLQMYQPGEEGANDFVEFFPRKMEKSLELGYRNKSYGILDLWFHQELEAFTGIDVYEFPFNTEEGYTVIERGNFKILILQSERVSQLSNVLGDFLGLENFKLCTDDISGNNAETMKNFVYKDFLNAVKFNQSYIDFYYKNNKFMDHFYSKEDQKRFLKRWENNIKKEGV